MSYVPPAISQNLIDAKGDLIVGTADNTVGRLAAGTADGYVLKVKSSASTGLEWGSTSSEQLIATISQNGYLPGPSTSIGGRAYVKGAWTITQVRASLGYPSQMQSVIVDVNKNGTTLFTTQANRPTLTTGTYTSAKTNMDVTTLADGDYLTADLDQADLWPLKLGATAPGNSPNGTYSISSNGTVFAVVGQGGLAQTSTDGNTWTTRTSQFSTSDIYKVIYAGSQFVAVGAAGKISTSSDGTTWSARTSNTTNAITDVAHNGTNYVAVAGGDIVYSSDGTTWTKVTPGGTFYGVCAAGASSWVAVGANVLRTSTDADLATWTSRSIPSVSNTDLYVAVANSSTVVVAGQAGNILSAAISDLATWTQRGVADRGATFGSTSSTRANRTGVWTGTQFVIASTVNGVVTSADGTTWQYAGSIPNDNIAQDLAYGNGLVVRSGNQAIYVSADEGGTWVRVPRMMNSNPISMPARYDGTLAKWVVGGNSQFMYGPSLVPARDLLVQVYGTPA